MLATGNDDALEGLHALARAFNHVDGDDNRVAGAEIGDGLAGGDAGEFFLFKNLKEIHFLLQSHHHAA